MEPKAIDPLEFREASTSSGIPLLWDERVEEFTDNAAGEHQRRAAGGARRRAAGSRGLGRRRRLWRAGADRGEEGRPRRPGVYATDISAEMLAFGVNALRRRAWANRVHGVNPPASISRTRASMPPSRAGESSSSLTPGRRRANPRLPQAGRADGDQLLGKPDQVPFLYIPMRTTMGRPDVPPLPPGTPGPPSRPTPDAIGGLLEEVGSRRSPWSAARSPSSPTLQSTSPPT